VEIFLFNNFIPFCNLKIKSVILLISHFTKSMTLVGMKLITYERIDEKYLKLSFPNLDKLLLVEYYLLLMKHFYSYKGHSTPSFTFTIVTVYLFIKLITTKSISVTEKEKLAL